jgi:hypothetical protein
LLLPTGEYPQLAYGKPHIPKPDSLFLCSIALRYRPPAPQAIRPLYMPESLTLEVVQ